MPRTALRWRDLIPGLVAVATLAAVAVATLLFARVGALRGETFDLHVLAGAAHDIQPGTDVWLVGQRVGTVSEVVLRPPSTDTTRRLLLRVELLERARPLVRRDSRVELRSGANPLGERVVALSPGSPGSSPVADGDTLLAAPEVDLRTLAGTFAEAGRHIPALRRDAGAIAASLRDVDGTLGAATSAEALAVLGELQGSLVGLTRQLSAADDGSLGPLLSSPELRGRVARAVARADSVRMLVASGSGTVGRFRRDSTLARQIAAVRDELSITRALLDQPVGTAGRARRDRAILAGLEEMERELELLARDVKRNPLRYLAF